MARVSSGRTTLSLAAPAAPVLAINELEGVPKPGVPAKADAVAAGVPGEEKGAGERGEGVMGVSGAGPTPSPSSPIEKKKGEERMKEGKDKWMEEREEN